MNNKTNTLAYLVFVFCTAYLLVQYRFDLTTNFFVRASDFDKFENWNNILNRRILVPYLADIVIEKGWLSLKAFSYLSEWFCLSIAALGMTAIGRQHFGIKYDQLLGFGLLVCYPFCAIMPRKLALLYSFDTPSLMFHTLGLLALIHKKFWLLIFIIALGTFNRETTLWLVMALAISEAPKTITFKELLKSPADYWYKIGFALLVFTSVKVALNSHISGSIAQFQLPIQIAYIKEAISELKLGRLIHLFSPVAFLHLYLLWNIKKVVLFQGFARVSWVAGFFFILMPLTSNLFELRIYIDMIPYVLVGTLDIWRNNPGGQNKPIIISSVTPTHHST